MSRRRCRECSLGLQLIDVMKTFADLFMPNADRRHSMFLDTLARSVLKLIDV